MKLSTEVNQGNPAIRTYGNIIDRCEKIERQKTVSVQNTFLEMPASLQKSFQVSKFNYTASLLPYKMNFAFRTYSENTVIFYASSSLSQTPIPPSSTFVIELVSRKLSLNVLKDGNVIISCISNSSYTDGNWKELHFSYSPDKHSYLLAIDGKPVCSDSITVPLRAIIPKTQSAYVQYFYLGGIDYTKTTTKTSFFFSNSLSSSQLSKFITGCFRNIYFGETEIEIQKLISENSARGSKISSTCTNTDVNACDGTSYCSNKGLCYSEGFTGRPSCDCDRTAFEGETCNIPIQVADIKKSEDETSTVVNFVDSNAGKEIGLRELNLSFRFKSEISDCVLLSMVSKQKDFIVVSLIGGKVLVSVKGKIFYLKYGMITKIFDLGLFGFFGICRLSFIELFISDFSKSISFLSFSNSAISKLFLNFCDFFVFSVFCLILGKFSDSEPTLTTLPCTIWQSTPVVKLTGRSEKAMVKFRSLTC